MFNNKIARSVLMLLAVSAFAACSNGSGSSSGTPAVNTQAVTEEVQQASVKIASTTDAEGREVALESSAVLQQLSQADRATVTRETSVEGVKHIIDLRNEAGSIAVFHANADMTQVAAVNGFAASHAEVAIVEGRIAQMLVRIDDAGRMINVVLAFGEQKQDETGCETKDAKQDDAKQGDAKQGDVKQDEEKCEPKKDEGKDEPKQDEPKQDEPKQDEPKQDEPKQDEPKQDEPKQDEPKQDEPKQDEPKQDEPKQDEPKQDEPKHDEPKHDEPKQDEPKQDGKNGKH